MILAATISILTLAEHVTGWNLGIDDLVFCDRATSVAISPVSRMAEKTRNRKLVLGPEA